MELLDLLLQLGLLAVARGAANLEQLLLAAHQARDLRIPLAPRQLVGELDGPVVVALGLETGLAGGQLVERLGHDAEIRLRLRAVEPDDHVALLHPVALLDQQLAHDAAGRVLDLLDVGIDHQLAGRDHGAGQLGRGRPSADAEDQEEAGRHTDQERFPGKGRHGHGRAHDGSRARTTGTRSGDGCAPVAGAAAGGGAAFRVSRRTASFGPKACCRPPRITRS